jgi:hypothetical protein
MKPGPRMEKKISRRSFQSRSQLFRLEAGGWRLEERRL